MALACDICLKVIPWVNFHGEHFQPHSNVYVRKTKTTPKRKYTHCFDHSMEEVDTFIKNDMMDKVVENG